MKIKQQYIFAIFFALIFGLAAFSAEIYAAPPANDNFAGALTLTLDNNTVGLVANNAEATKEPGEPVHAGNAGGKSLWFKFTPQTTTNVRIQTMETTIDTLLGIYKGTSFGNLVKVAENDNAYPPNSGAGQISWMEIKLEAGQTYYIAVDGYNNGSAVSSGVFRLALSVINVPSSDNLSQPIELFVNANLAGTIFNATREQGEPAHHGGSNGLKSVWFRWTSLTAKSMTIELEEDFSSQIGVYSTNVANPNFNQLQPVTSNAAVNGYTTAKYRVRFFAEAGKTYYIAVDRINAVEGNEGNFHIKLSRNPLRYSTRFFGGVDRAYLSVFRPGDGFWHSNLPARNNSQFDSTFSKQFGVNGDQLLPADYDGDGRTDFAVARNAGGLKQWYITTGGAFTFYSMQWGLASDKALTGDFDLDGRADLVVVRATPQGLVWYIRESLSGELKTRYWGTSLDKPVLGDFDGDGATDLAVTRNTQNGTIWYILKSEYFSEFAPYSRFTATQFGTAQDIAAAEDYDGDGKTDIAVWRPSSNVWYVLCSSNNQLYAKDFGSAGAKPQPADFDGDGKADFAFYLPSEGNWYVLNSGNNQMTVKNWGVSTDIPVTSLSILLQ